MSFRLDHNRLDSGVIIYVPVDIPSKQLTKYKLPEVIKGSIQIIQKRKKFYSKTSQTINYFEKPFLSDNCNHTSKISFVHNGVISDDSEFGLAKKFKDFFDNAVDTRRHFKFDFQKTRYVW